MFQAGPYLAAGPFADPVSRYAQLLGQAGGGSTWSSVQIRSEALDQLLGFLAAFWGSHFICSLAVDYCRRRAHSGGRYR